MCPSSEAPGFTVEPAPPGTGFVEVRHFAEIDSTNRYLVDEARAGAPAGLVAVADHQTAGRGRLGRRWEAPPGANLLVSVLVDPGVDPSRLHLCSVAAALAAAAACRRVGGVPSALKWPNDLLVGERKLGGVLAESVGSSGRLVAVVGIGVNVAWPPAEGEGSVPEELRTAATSLERERGSAVDRDALLGDLLVELDARLDALARPAGTARLLEEYRASCATLGRTVRVELGERDVIGTAKEVTAEGHLVVEGPTGPEEIVAGDVVHLRLH